jgi:hypothetical protein
MFFFISNCIANFAIKIRHSGHLERRKRISFYKGIDKTLFIFPLQSGKEKREREVFSQGQTLSPLSFSSLFFA